MATFSYFSEDDALEYDYEAAMPIVQQLESDISAASQKLGTLVTGLEKLQRNCHEPAGSAITEDYKDFSSLIGNESDGVSGFILDVNDLVGEISSTLTEWYNQTHR